MPRPPKKRRVCQMPKWGRFVPEGTVCRNQETIQMTVEEYETLRLIDLEEKTQEECAAQMGVARTTVQSIYHQGRKKVAEALVTGKVLLIEGGDYRLCEYGAERCAGCMKACGRLYRKGEQHENRSNL